MWRTILISAWGLLGVDASAAPWVQDPEGFYIRTAYAGERVEGEQGTRVDGYVEYGLSDRFTLTGKVDTVRYENAEDFNTSGWRTTLRAQLFERDGFVGAIEAGLLEGAAIGGRNGCERLGAELRSGVAWSGQWQDRSLFLFGEVAGRTHNGCDRARLEFGYGQEIADRIWFLGQVWSERGSVNADSDKYQAESLWRTDAFDLSVGYRIELGRSFEEESIFIALARQF